MYVCILLHNSVCIMHHHGNTVHVYYCANRYITMVMPYMYIIVLTHGLVFNGIGISYTVLLFLLYYCGIIKSLRYELKIF